MTNVRGPKTGLPLLALALSVGVACQEPTVPPPESPAVARVQEAGQWLQKLEESELDRVVAIREEVLASLGLRLHRHTDNSPPDPGQYLGKTLVRDASTHEHELDESATGAPANGVRVILYRHTSAGALQIPLAEEGFIDFTYDQFGGNVELLVRVEVDGVERLEMRDGSAYTGEFGEQFLPMFNGTIGENEDYLDFSIHKNLNEATDDLSVRIRMEPWTTLEFDLVEDLASGEVQGGLGFNWQDGQELGNLITMRASFGGTKASVTVQGEANLDIATDDRAHTYTHNFELSGTLASPGFDFACCEDPPAGLQTELASLLDTVVSSTGWLADTFGMGSAMP